MADRILIIDDDARLAAMVSDYLSAAGFAVERCLTAADGLKVAERGAMDAVILDLMLPDLDGFEVCRRLRAQSDVPILMLTARGEDTDRIVGLEIGADDYLAKPFNPRVLLARIRAILRRRGSAKPDGAALHFGRLHIDRGSRAVHVDGENRVLTSYQFDLLAALAENAGRVLNRDRLLDLVKGEDLEAFDRSIDVHISRIRAAIEDDPKHPRRIITVRGSGYVFAKTQDQGHVKVVRRRLFWKIYVTLLASLIAAIVFMGAFFWFLGEAQREGTGETSQSERAATGSGPRDVTLYEKDGRMIGSRGPTIALSDYTAGRHGGPGHVTRIDLPDGRFALTRFGPPVRARALRFLAIMLVVAGGVGLAAYPVTALLTRRLEALRKGMTRWGEAMTPVRLDDRGSDEVALLAKTFNRAAARLDALLASQKALLANASHELRSPIARLRVAIEMAPRDGSNASHDEIVRNLAEMDQLVDELLLSSRLDHAGPHRDGRETIDILGLSAEEAARYDAVVTGEPADMVGDAVLLRRLVRNLLENGVKHGRPPVAIAVSRRGDGVELVVSDNGDGIAASDRDRIFEPFYRPSGSGEGSGGWGLGLALVRQIAERHHGHVECREGPSGGSRFVVTLRTTDGDASRT